MHVLFILITLLLLTPNMTASSEINHKHMKIMVVHSGTRNDITTKPMLIGLKRYFLDLNRCPKCLGVNHPIYSLSNIYLNKSGNQIQTVNARQLVSQAYQEINRYKPDVIVTLGDDAWSYVGKPLSKKYKIVYVGNNKSMNEYLKTDINAEINIDNIAGLIHTVNFSTLDNLIHVSNITINKIYIITNSSEIISLTNRHLINNILSTVRNEKIDHPIEMVKVGTDEQLINFLDDIKNKERSLLIVGLDSLYSVRTNKLLNEYQIADLIVSNNNIHIELTTNQRLVREGYAMSIGSLQTDLGYKAGKLVSKMLLNEKLPKREFTVKPKIVVNSKRLFGLQIYTFIDDCYKHIDIIY